MNRRLKYLFAASLVLNLALIGVIAGHAVRCTLWSSQTPEAAVAELPADKRALLETAMKKADADTAGLRKQVSEARKKAADILKAEPFDQHAYVAQAARVYALKGQILQRMVTAVSDLAAQLTPQERNVLEEFLHRRKLASCLAPEDAAQQAQH